MNLIKKILSQLTYIDSLLDAMQNRQIRGLKRTTNYIKKLKTFDLDKMTNHELQVLSIKLDTIEAMCEDILNM